MIVIFLSNTAHMSRTAHFRKNRTIRRKIEQFWMVRRFVEVLTTFAKKTPVGNSKALL